jgi:hypothetical protein
MERDSGRYYKEITIKDDGYYFIPFKDDNSYKHFHSITDIFEQYRVGIQTHRDTIAIGFERDELLNRLLNFSKMSPEDARQKFKLGKDNREWSVEKLQCAVQQCDQTNVRKIQYTHSPNDCGS